MMVFAGTFVGVVFYETVAVLLDTLRPRRGLLPADGAVLRAVHGAAHPDRVSAAAAGVRGVAPATGGEVLTEKASSRLKILALLVVADVRGAHHAPVVPAGAGLADFREDANNTSFRWLQVEPERGRILDSNGNPLVDNRESRVVTVQQQLLGSDPEAVLFRLAQHLGVPEKDIVRKMDDPDYYDYQRIPVAVDVSEDKIFYIAEHPKLFPGVGWGQQSVRRYPDGPLAAHVLGTVGLISSDEAKDPAVRGLRRRRHRRQGRAGEDLRALPARHAGHEQDRRRTPPATLLDELGGQLPVPGDDVKLYLEREDPEHRRAGPAGRHRARAVAQRRGPHQRRDELRRQRRCRRRDGPEDGWRGGLGLVAHLRPDPVRQGDDGQGVQAAVPQPVLGRPALRPGDPGRVRAGVDVQAVHRARGAQERRALARAPRPTARAQCGVPTGPGSPVQQLVHLRPGLHVDPRSPPGLVRHGLLPVGRRVLRPSGGRTSWAQAPSRCSTTCGGSASAASPASTSRASRPGSSPPRRGRSSSRSRTRRTSRTGGCRATTSSCRSGRATC